VDDEEFESTLQEARRLIEVSVFIELVPDLDDDPLADLFDLVLHQGSPGSALLAIIDEIHAITPHQPTVIPLFFGTLLSGLESSLGHPRWTHPSVDDYKYADATDQLIHHHLVRLSPHFRPYLTTMDPEIRTAAAALTAYVGREHPETYAEYWEAAVTLPNSESEVRPTILNGMKCFPAQPEFFDRLIEFSTDTKNDQWSVFAVQSTLLHWGAYSEDTLRGQLAVTQLAAAQRLVASMRPAYARDVNADGQVARGRLMRDPMQRWEGWMPFLPGALLDGTILGKMAFDLMDSAEASAVLVNECIQAAESRSDFRFDPSRMWLMEILLNNGLTLTDGLRSGAH